MSTHLFFGLGNAGRLKSVIVNSRATLGWVSNVGILFLLLYLSNGLLGFIRFSSLLVTEHGDYVVLLRFLLHGGVLFALLFGGRLISTLFGLDSRPTPLYFYLTQIA